MRARSTAISNSVSGDELATPYTHRRGHELPSDLVTHILKPGNGISRRKGSVVDPAKAGIAVLVETESTGLSKNEAYRKAQSPSRRRTSII